MAALSLRSWAWTGSTLLLVFSVASAADGQSLFGLGRWQGQGIFRTDWDSQDDRRTNTKDETILFQERLKLRHTGLYVLNPEFWTLNLGGSFGLSQEKALAQSDRPLRVGDGTLYDYAFESLFLAERATPVTVFATRDETTLSQGFGGRSHIIFESRGGVFDLREGSFLENYGWHRFTSSLDVHQELLNEDSSVFGSPFRRDETHNIVRYRAHQGGETSDLDLRYELNDVSDPENATNEFQSHTVHADHSMDFGPTLNRRVNSNVYFYDRTGAAPGNFVSVDEGLRLDHDRDFNSQYRYDFSRSDSDAGVLTTHSGDLELMHRWYGNLTTTADARGAYQHFPDGERTTGAGHVGLAYARSLPWQTHVFAEAKGGVQVDDNSFSSSEIDVVDEKHTAPVVLGAGSGFTLNNGFVLTETVVVIDVRGGSRLPTQLDVDYTLSQEGSLTKVIPLAGSPVIQPSDPLEVSYAFAVDPSLRYSTATAAAKLGFGFRWATISYEHLLSDEAKLSGESSGQTLVDENVDRFKLELLYQRERMRAESIVSYELLRSTIADSNAWRFMQALSYQLRRDASIQLSGDQYLVDYVHEDRKSRSYLGRLGLEWHGIEGLSVTPFAGYRSFRDSSATKDDIIDWGVRARWTYRSLQVAPTFVWTEYKNRLRDVRAELRITRFLF